MSRYNQVVFLNFFLFRLKLIVSQVVVPTGNPVQFSVKFLRPREGGTNGKILTTPCILLEIFQTPSVTTLNVYEDVIKELTIGTSCIFPQRLTILIVLLQVTWQTWHLYYRGNCDAKKFIALIATWLARVFISLEFTFFFKIDHTTHLRVLVHTFWPVINALQAMVKWIKFRITNLGLYFTDIKRIKDFPIWKKKLYFLTLKQAFTKYLVSTRLSQGIREWYLF